MMNKLFNRADRATTYSVLDAYFHDTVNCTFNRNLFFTTLLYHKRFTCCKNIKKAITNVVNICMAHMGYTCKCNYREVARYLKRYGIDVNALAF